MIVQGSHASLKAVLDVIKKVEIYELIKETSRDATTFGDFFASNNIPSLSYDVHDYFISNRSLDALYHWIDNLFTKICVSVDSEEELLDIYNKGKNAGLICALIQDAGRTEFNGVPTYTCCSILGWKEDVDVITKDLKLL